MQYTPQPPHGQLVQNDPHFSLMADADGVGFIHCGDAVVVVPLTASGDVLLAVERSPARDGEILTLVSGSIEAGKSLEGTAVRELQEEIGWRAERLDFLGELHPFKYLTTRQFVFLARDLTPSKLAGDETHAITERRVSVNDFTDLCQAGELQDASAIAALYLARDYLTPSDRHDGQKGNASR